MFLVNSDFGRFKVTKWLDSILTRRLQSGAKHVAVVYHSDSDASETFCNSGFAFTPTSCHYRSAELKREPGF